VCFLSQTCKYFHSIISNRVFWLYRLHALEQDRAPNLPHHISISTLSMSKLRSLVIHAHRRYHNCTRPGPVRPTKEITVHIKQPPGRSYCWELLPGGELLLVCWNTGLLQCLKVPSGECIWEHAPVPKGQFGYEMQANGDVHVFMVSDPESIDNGIR
ncbi:hypothetical protein DFH11DRAFT_1792290, partial [Phellopilus nigrolimitatus]